MTVIEYRKAITEHNKLYAKGIVTYKLPMKNWPPELIEEMKQFDNQIKQFEANNPRYKIVCIKSCYVGQGVDWKVDDVYDLTYDLDYANAIVKMFDEDSWVGPGYFEVVEMKK